MMRGEDNVVRWVQNQFLEPGSDSKSQETIPGQKFLIYMYGCREKGVYEKNVSR